LDRRRVLPPRVAVVVRDRGAELQEALEVDKVLVALVVEREVAVAPPGGPSGRVPVVLTRWNSLPSFVERWINMVVVKPHGPHSQRRPSASAVTSGSPSVRCGSTTVAGANLASHAEYDGIGVTVIGFVVEPGGVAPGSGSSVIVTVPA